MKLLLFLSCSLHAAEVTSETPLSIKELFKYMHSAQSVYKEYCQAHLESLKKTQLHQQEIQEIGQITHAINYKKYQLSDTLAAAIKVAVALNDVEQVQQILDLDHKGSSFSTVTIPIILGEISWGRSPGTYCGNLLHFAIKCGHVPIVELLLKNGIDPYKKDGTNRLDSFGYAQQYSPHLLPLLEQYKI